MHDDDAFAIAAASVQPSAPAPAARVPVLLVAAGTGGGHLAAAQAVAQALERTGSGRFAAVLCDPLIGPDAPRQLRSAAALYAPVIRWLPWLWAGLYYGTDSPGGVALLRLLARPATGPVAAAVVRTRPVAIVSLHPLTCRAAVRARDQVAVGTPVIGVVTDPVDRHRVWDDELMDRLVLPQSAVAARMAGRTGRSVRVIGVPVAAQFAAGPPGPRERAALRGWLGVDADRFLVVVTGGAAGAGRMAQQVRALARLDGVGVVALCGHNRRLARRLTTVAGRSAGRVRVLGFVTNMADWLRCADVVVGKAGPGTIAEATCCGTPLLLTSHVPGQERGNAAPVVSAGAGRQPRGVRQLVREVVRLRDDPALLATMRSASAGLGRPAAAGEVATLLAEMVGAGRGCGHAAR